MAKKTTHHSEAFFELLHWLKTVGVSLLLVASLILLFIAIPRPYYTQGFNTLSDLKTLIKDYDEFIKMEGKNAAFPSYETYYKKKYENKYLATVKEKSEWILSTLHIKQTPLFSSSYFKKTLTNVSRFRQNKAWAGNFIQKIELNTSSKLVVFGVVQGAFHGLIRYLEKLKELEIIDENLVVKNPDYFLVFLGNVINRSPYTLEIFSVVLKLLEKNPHNVIYLKGTNEFPDYWRQHSLRRELELRANHLSHSVIPLQEEIDTFFHTLPLTLYCTMPYLSHDTTNYFKLAGFIEDEHLLKMIDAPTYASFLRQKTTEKISAFNLNNRNEFDPEATKILSKAIIRDIKKRDFYESMNGLRLLSPTKGITTWTVFSTAAEPFREAFKHFYEAFVIINPEEKTEDWTIDLYNRDVRIKNNIFKKQSYFFFSGEPLKKS
jgi:hypothetical protein